MKKNNIIIVSLSRGIIGEPFVKHEFDIGVKRLNDFGLNVSFSNSALKGIDYISKHPEERAKDLIDALNSDTDIILCAIGGDDTYRLLPYLFNDDVKISEIAKDKVFLGFSDTTINHLMLHKLGINTFYGQAFLSDICELDVDMLPYTKKYFTELIETGTISEITPSDVWYESREDFSKNAIGTSTLKHKNNGFELLRGSPVFKGKILGGCIDSLFDIFNNERYSDSPELCNSYGLFPSLEDWKGRILLLESSEEKPTPDKYRRMVKTLKDTGVFNVLSGVLIGKPADETYFDEYKKILLEEINNKDLPIVVNINVGHSLPRCIIPFGIDTTVDIKKQKIIFNKK